MGGLANRFDEPGVLCSLATRAGLAPTSKNKTRETRTLALAKCQASPCSTASSYCLGGLEKAARSPPLDAEAEFEPAMVERDEQRGCDLEDEQHDEEYDRSDC